LTCPATVYLEFQKLLIMFLISSHLKKNLFSSERLKEVLHQDGPSCLIDGYKITEEFHKNGMISEKIPDWLQKSAVDKVNSLSVFGGKNANHVLLNEYKPGEGIMPHLDGDLFYPTITTISIGSHAVLNFYEPEEDKDTACRSWNERLVLSLYVEPRSLLVLQQDMYHKYLHGIDQITADHVTKQYPNLNKDLALGSDIERSIRYSLTIRHVPKTTKFKLKLGR